MTSRKRSFRAVEGESEDAEPSLLHRIRNMWHFANLCQWIYIFGKAAKIDESIDIEDIELECLKPKSEVLEEIALALLKLVSSHRGLTHDTFDHQARKQYLSRAPARNPFGDDEAPIKFHDFDIFTKIKVLQQLTQWAMVHPERIREKMDEQKDTEQTSWRIEPYGWDAEDRTYYVLDDNRVYRLTEPPLNSKPKVKPRRNKNWRAGRRSSKRRRVTLPVEDQTTDTEIEGENNAEAEDDGLGGMTWECLAVSLDDVRSLVDGFRKSRDENERVLKSQLEVHLVPILEKQEESRKRKELQRERELVNLAKMANAKRSSRIAGKLEQQKLEERAREEEQQRREAETARRREEAAHLKSEKERDRRMASREKRLREREARRLRHEEELAQLSEDSKHMSTGSGRMSERQRQAEIDRNKQALKDLQDEEEDWVFDCLCGLHGQVDDGAHSLACERCNVWQHSKCLGISEETAELPEFRFVCSSCTRREQEAKSRHRPTIKLKLHHGANPGAHPAQALAQARAQATGENNSSTRPAPQTPTLLPERTNQLPQHQGATGGHPALHPAPPLGAGQPGAPSSGSGVVLSPNSTLQHGMSPGQTAGRNIGMNRLVDLGSDELMARGKTQGPVSPNHQPNMSATPPFVAATPTNGIHSVQGGRAFESALSTPNISRDIYRATYLENGTLPAQAGLSPTKHSPPRSAGSESSRKINTTTPILPPITSLSPSPRQPVLTPPSKSPEPVRPPESR